MIPKWISIEGIDGSGKTTAVKWLELYLRNKGFKVVVLKGLGSGTIGSFIREMVIDDTIADNLKALTMSVALIDCYNELEELLEERNTVVITDRFIGSYYAYNYKANKDIAAKSIHTNILKNKAIINKYPCLELFIDIDLDIAKERLNMRSNESNHIDRMPIEYFEKVRQGYLEYMMKTNAKIYFTITNNLSIELLEVNIDRIIKLLENVKSN